MTARQQRELLTSVEILIHWTDPAEGFYVPSCRVSGYIPDGLDTMKLIGHYIRATHAALRYPSLTADGAFEE